MGICNILYSNPLMKWEDDSTVKTPHICVGFLDYNNLTNPNWLLNCSRCETNKARESWWPLIQHTAYFVLCHILLPRSRLMPIQNSNLPNSCLLLGRYPFGFIAGPVTVISYFIPLICVIKFFFGKHIISLP